MSESFNWQRFRRLFVWQNERMAYNRYIVISLLVVITAFLNGNRHIVDVHSYSDKFVFFIFLIVFCTNFFRHLTNGDSIAPFLLLPSTVTEKFLFLLSGVVIIPMALIFGLVEISEQISLHAHRISDTQHVLVLENYLILFLVASVTFFVHCLPQKRWTIGLSLLFIAFLIPMGVGYFKRKAIAVPIVSDMLTLFSQPIVAVVLASVILVLAYIFFKQNVVSKFKRYE